jgi:hypothetical protein
MSKTADADKSTAKAAPKPASKSTPKAPVKVSPEPGTKVESKAAESKVKAKPKASKDAVVKAAAPKEAPAKASAAVKAPAGSTAKAAAPKAPAGVAAKAPMKTPLKGPVNAVVKVAGAKVTEGAAAKAPARVSIKVSEKMILPRAGTEKFERAAAAAQSAAQQQQQQPVEDRSLEPRQPDRTSANGRMMVTGPLETKRFGRTLVIDISAPQVALTARRGLSLPRASLIVTTAAREIIILAREAVKVDTIVVVGSDGDPSNHPDLREITENLRALRDKHLPRAKIRVFTATRDLTSYDLRSTLAMYDRVHLQFEWGSAKVFSAVTGEKPTQFATLVKHASSFDHLVIEANFFKGPEDKDNSVDAEVKLWIKKLQELKPQEIHILPGVGSGAAGGPNTGAGKVKPAAKSRRDEITEEVAEKTGLNVSQHDDEALLV